MTCRGLERAPESVLQLRAVRQVQSSRLQPVVIKNVVEVESIHCVLAVGNAKIVLAIAVGIVHVVGGSMTDHNHSEFFWYPGRAHVPNSTLTEL